MERAVGSGGTEGWGPVGLLEEVCFEEVSRSPVAKSSGLWVEVLIA